jgi:hypothetical protein
MDTPMNAHRQVVLDAPPLQPNFDASKVITEFFLDAPRPPAELPNQLQAVLVEDNTIKCLTYAEKFPPFRLFRDMVSKFVNFVRKGGDTVGEKRKSTFITAPLDDPLDDATWDRKELSEKEPGPFLGPLHPGESQLGMVNSLFRVPVFRHDTRTDFLFLLVWNENEAQAQVIPVTTVWKCGQQEPQQYFVPFPQFVVTKTEKNTAKKVTPKKNEFRLKLSKIHQKVLALTIAQYFEQMTLADRVNIETLKNDLLRPDDCQRFVSAVKHFVQLVDRIGYKISSSDDNNATAMYRRRSASESEAYFHVSALKKSLTPEELCLHRSSLEGFRRLSDMGLLGEGLDKTFMSIEKCFAWIETMKNLRKFKRNRAIYMKNYMDQHYDKTQVNKLLRYLALDMVALDKRLKLGNFIFRELIRAPWNSTSAFFATMIEPDGKPMDLDFEQRYDAIHAIHYSFLRVASVPATVIDYIEYDTLSSREAFLLLMEMKGGRGGASFMHKTDKYIKREVKKFATEQFKIGNQTWARYAKRGTSAPQNTPAFVNICRRMWEKQCSFNQSLRTFDGIMKDVHSKNPTEDDDDEKAADKIMNDVILTTEYLQQNEQVQLQNERTLLNSYFRHLAPATATAAGVAGAAGAAAAAVARPRVVVRKTTRTVTPDGEKVEIEFCVTATDVRNHIKLTSGQFAMTGGHS